MWNLFKILSAAGNFFVNFQVKNTTIFWKCVKSSQILSRRVSKSSQKLWTFESVSREFRKKIKKFILKPPHNSNIFLTFVHLDTAHPAYINVLKALMQASYRIIAMRRTWLHENQAAALFGLNYQDYLNGDPTSMEEAASLEWARKLSSGSSLVLAVQRHGACYALLDSTLENFKELDQHVYCTKTRQDALHFSASLFNRFPQDAVWKIELDPWKKKLIIMKKRYVLLKKITIKKL